MFHILRSSDIISIAVIFIFCLPVSLEFFLCSYRSNLSQVIFKIDVRRNFKISYTKPAVSNSLLNRKKKKIWKKPSQQLCSRRLILVLSMLSAKESRQTDHFNSAQKLLFTILLQNICSELLGKTHIKALGIPYPFSKVAGSQLFAKKGRHCRCFPVSFAKKKKKKKRSAAFYNMIG